MAGSLSDEEIQERLGDLPGWRHEGPEIAKWYRLGGFPEAAAFVQALVEPAERLNHHPDIEVHERRVRIGIHTWSQDAITENDFALAAEIERIAGET